MLITIPFTVKNGPPMVQPFADSGHSVMGAPHPSPVFRIESRRLRADRTRSIKIFSESPSSTERPSGVSIDSDRNTDPTFLPVPTPEEHLLHALSASLNSSITQQAAASGLTLKAINSVATASFLGAGDATGRDLENNPGRICIEVVIDAEGSQEDIQRVFHCGVAACGLIQLIDRNVQVIVGIAG